MCLCLPWKTVGHEKSTFLRPECHHPGFHSLLPPRQFVSIQMHFNILSSVSQNHSPQLQLICSFMKMLPAYHWGWKHLFQDSVYSLLWPLRSLLIQVNLMQQPFLSFHTVQGAELFESEQASGGWMETLILLCNLDSWVLCLSSLVRLDSLSMCLSPCLDYSFMNCWLLGLRLDFLASIPDLWLTSALRILRGPVLIFQFPDLLLGLIFSSHRLCNPQFAY